MNIRFKKQEYQLNAVKSVVDCFKGQQRDEGIGYLIDRGNTKQEIKEEHLFSKEYEDDDGDILSGFKNNDWTITTQKILENIYEVQKEQNLPLSNKLATNSVCNINLDVEMETGTGKTYVYTRTCFELNKQYGWSKFIIVVPSVAIREGVHQSIELTREHFMQEYGKQVRAFIYNSKELHQCESFSSDANINIMIINSQAFNATGKDARKIYEKLDSFGSRRPIDVIKANRPILIIDEPQKIEGDEKKESNSFKALKEFDPLFILRYSATFRKEHNKIHRLDALDAYNQKLVKKISVRGVSVKGLGGTNAYLYLQDIVLDETKAPVAKLEFEVKTKSGIKRVLKNIQEKDNLETHSNGLAQYKGFVVSEIDGYKNKIFFTNGTELSICEASGDVNEESIRRIQIRDAIKAHLQKEQALFSQDIKVLSLFFIDEVAKYRVYEGDDESNGEYARVFEEEYEEALKDMGLIFDEKYEKYLKSIKVDETHKGYFAQDKQKKMINPKVNARGENAGNADDVDAYDLILKDKKKLLSLEEPTRFIFSHSALREGWDNPNVFVICTLKHSDNTISRRQEVGRGMRICVNSQGERMDNLATVHKTNILTVVANESYADFVQGLQKDIVETLSSRPKVANAEYFANKTMLINDEKVKVNEDMAKKIYRYLIKNDYINDDDMISETYHEDKKADKLVELPQDLEPFKEGIFNLIDSIFNNALLKDMITDDTKNRINPLNKTNFDKKEFQELWNSINQKAVYTVDFDSNELAEKAKNAINKELHIQRLSYTITSGTQTDKIAYESVQSSSIFKEEKKENIIEKNIRSNIKYDLIGQIAQNTELTRNTICQILKAIRKDKFELFEANPEDFILQMSRIINEQKAAMVISKLTYNPIDEKFENNIFFAQSEKQNFEKAKEVKKHIYINT